MASKKKRSAAQLKIDRRLGRESKAKAKGKKKTAKKKVTKKKAKKKVAKKKAKKKVTKKGSKKTTKKAAKKTTKKAAAHPYFTKKAAKRRKKTTPRGSTITSKDICTPKGNVKIPQNVSAAWLCGGKIRSGCGGGKKGRGGSRVIG